jgi:predicted DCC family thiol-disulfide oxidoreductase YuxK
MVLVGAITRHDSQVPPAAPNLPVLVYDGDCAFCTRSAQWAAKRLPPPASAKPSHSIDLDALGLTHQDVARAAWWVDADRRRWGGHLAVGKALVAAGGWRALLGHVVLVPPRLWLAKPVYGWVARNRSRMPGGSPTCGVG